MLTIGHLARRFGISRSTLLYYDRIRLLRPSLRSPSNYRLYSETDVRRMERIATLREAGLPLNAIRHLLDSESDSLDETLEQRLSQLNGEIAERRSQQKMIVQLLKRDEAIRETRMMDKNRWVAMLEGAGMDEEAKKRFHVLFEKDAPEAHQDFLESLGLDQNEISSIREAAGRARH